jgi:hypothetical protein
MASYLLGLLFKSEDGGGIFLRNSGKLLNIIILIVTDVRISHLICTELFCGFPQFLQASARIVPTTLLDLASGFCVRRSMQIKFAGYRLQQLYGREGDAR